MGIRHWIAGKWAGKRAAFLKREATNALALQKNTLYGLIEKAAHTAFGTEHEFAGIRNAEEFREKVPSRDYESARTWFDRIASGEKDVTWPGKPLYLAKTSGTVSGSKAIPITRDSIPNHINSARDALLIYIYNSGNPAFTSGKMLFLSGSPDLETNEGGIRVGRLSGIVNHWVPGYLQRNKTPSWSANCIEDWERKVDAILDETMQQDLRLISGIPPWVQMFFEKLEARGKMPREQWPHLQLFVHGGVDFKPYQAVFQRFLGDSVDLLEVFPASEGFFAWQDSNPENGLLLNVNSGIYFEFIPMDEYGKPNAGRIGLDKVEIGIQYALLITSNAGLWAYDIGDTVRFVSLQPPRLKVTGRVKHFISAFGEHVIAEEVNTAMTESCLIHNAGIREFHVAPRIKDEPGESCHEWLVEFENLPADINAFSACLDSEIRKRNVYYNDLRAGNILHPAKLTMLETGAVYEYMKASGKLGGQNKFPRLSNDRNIASQLRVAVKQD